MTARLLCCLMCLLVAAADVAAQERDREPMSIYQNESIHGFTVFVSPQVLAHREAVEDVLAELARQLGEVAEVVPPAALSALRKVRIWVEWNSRSDVAAEFHPSARWLEENGYNPAKAGDVEVSNSLNFVHQSRAEQPCMVLHELAHAFHFLVLGERHPEVAAAYQHAVERRSYESVEHVGGGTRRAYALVDEKEYFAELSEAYFGKNDYYPFTRADLRRHDPVGYELLERLWGTTASSGL